jgi:hypothetical protein
MCRSIAGHVSFTRETSKATKRSDLERGDRLYDKQGIEEFVEEIRKLKRLHLI